MVSSFLVLNHYFLINFNYVDSCIAPTFSNSTFSKSPFGDLKSYTVVVRMQYFTTVLKYFKWLLSYRSGIWSWARYLKAGFIP